LPSWTPENQGSVDHQELLNHTDVWLAAGEEMTVRADRRPTPKTESQGKELEEPVFFGWTADEETISNQRCWFL